MKQKERIVYTFILLLPFIDFLTSIATWENFVPIGMIFKGLFLLYAVYYLFYKCENRKKHWFIIGLIVFYCLGSSIYWFITDKSILVREMIHLIKVFYLPILLLFFANYENQYFHKKTFFYLSLFFLFLYLLPYPFHLGHNMSEVYPNKNLYLSYFYIGNELANVFILLVPVAILYLLESKSKFFFLYMLCVLLMLLLLGTKTMYLSVFIILGYFLYYFRKSFVRNFKKYWKIGILLFGCFFLGILVWLPRSQFYQNIQTTFDFYDVHSFTDLFTLENVDHILYSNRLEFLWNIHEEYVNSSIGTKLMGLGRVRITSMKDIEIDIFDIFYSIGFIGFAVYFIVMVYVFGKLHLRGIYKFLFLLLFVISLFTGHVLISPMTASYFSLLVGINYNERRRENETLDEESIKET